jgi:peroxiredoxin
MIEKMAKQITMDGLPATFTFLSDSGHKVIDRYGLLNPNGQGWPHPTVYVIDRKGMVRWKFTEVNYRIRPTNAMILAALDAVRGDG